MKSTVPIKSWQVYLVFFVSGASALVYQVLWLRWLGLIFGNTTASVSIVLASFMCGLAIGGWLIGPQLRRIGRPLRAYALVEIAIGGFAVAFPLIAKIVEYVFVALIDSDSSNGYALAVRATLAFAVLLVPTALMGATLPLLTDFFRRNPRASREWKVGVLYTANTLGAAVGVLITGLVLIELFGVRMTSLLAALLNFLVGWIAWRLGGIASISPEKEDQSAVGRLPANARLAIAVLTATGGLALAAEVLWTRAMETLMGTSTYAFSCIVFVFLVGIAGGSWLMSRFLARIGDKVTGLLVLVLFMAVWMVVGIHYFGYLFTHLRFPVGEMAGMGTIFLIYFLIVIQLVPLALASGACFPLVTHILTPSGKEAEGALVARAYVWNTFGAVGGSLIGGFVVAPWFDYMPALYVIAMGYGLGGTLGALYWWKQKPSRGRLTLVAAGFCGCAAVAYQQTHETSYAERYGRFSGTTVVFHRPGIQAVTTVARAPDRELADILLVNGIGMTMKVTDTKMMAHLPMLIHPAPRDTLVICFGMGTTFRSALSHGGKVTVVELVGDVFEVFPYFFRDAAAVFANPRGRCVVNDGRNFLATTKEKFDIITLDPPPPIDAAGVNNLYSLDFIELARDHLKEGGFMAHWYPLIGTHAGVDDQHSFQMLTNTFCTAFPYVYAIRGYHDVGLHLIGSMQPITINKEEILRRLQSTEVSRDMREFDDVPDRYCTDGYLKMSANPLLEVVTDDSPLLEYYFLRTFLQGREKLIPGR